MCYIFGKCPKRMHNQSVVNDAHMFLDTHTHTALGKPVACCLLQKQEQNTQLALSSDLVSKPEQGALLPNSCLNSPRR